MAPEASAASIRLDPLDADPTPEAAVRETAMESVLVAVGEVGYREVSVRSILERSGGHRAQFYEQFESKEDCFAQAYAAWMDRLCVSLLEAAATTPGWEGGIQAAIVRLFEFATVQPVLARALLVEGQIAGEPMTARYEATLERLAAAVDTVRADIDPADAPPEATGSFVVGGIASSVTEALTAGEPERIWDSLPELMHFAVGAYLGSEDAEDAFERAHLFLERRRTRLLEEAAGAEREAGR